VGQNWGLKIGNIIKSMAQFKYLGMSATNQNLIQEEIKRRLNSGNASYHSVQLSPHLLLKNVNIRYNTVILLVALYGCGTWSLTLRKEYRLRMFEKRVLRRIFGLKKDEVTGGWIKQHNEELCDLYSLPSIIRIIKWKRMRWVGYVALMGEKRNMHRLFVGKPEGKRPLGRPRCR
jgi:hypothetical protein